MPLDFSAFAASPQRKSRLDFSAFRQEEESPPSTLDKVAAAIPEPVKNTVSTVLDYLGRPGAAAAGFVAGALSDAQGEEGSAVARALANLTGARRDDFDQVLEEQGFGDSTARHIAGFVGDLVIDPLNLVGAGPAKWALQGAAKATKLTDAVNAVAGAARAADAKLGGHIAQAAKDLAKKFVPYHGLPEDYAQSRRLLDAELSTIDERKARELRKRFANTTPEFRTEVAIDIEKGAGRTDAHDAFVQQHRQIEDALHQRQVAAGMMKEEAFIPNHVRHDYTARIASDPTVRHMQTANLSKRNKNAISRQNHERTLEEAMARGAEGDLAKIQFRYEKEAERASRVGEFIQETAERFGQRLPTVLTEGSDEAIAASRAARREVEDRLLAEGYDVLDIPEDHPLFKKVGDVMLPKSIVEDLQALRTPRPEMGKVGKMFNRLMQMWRTQATVLRPAHHVTNFAGNTFNAYLGGLVNPLRYWEAGTWHLIDDAAKIGRYTKAEVDDFMQRTGLGQWHTSNLTSEMGDVDHADALVRQIAKDAKGPESAARKLASGVRHPVQTAKKVGSEIENFSKRALFIDRLKKGDTLEEAFNHTNKYLFNYLELTDWEKRYMRNIFPFYTWMRKNIPLQVESLVTQPHKYAAVAKGINAIEGVSEERGNLTPDWARPTYLQDLNAIQLPTAPGQPKQHLNPYLPYQDLNMIPVDGSGIEQTLRQLGSSINPLAKIPAELAFNQNLFFGSRLYNKDAGMTGDTQPLPATLAWLPGWLKDILFTETKAGHEIPFLAKYALQQSPFAEAVGKASQSVFQPEEATNPFSAEAFLTGVRRVQRTRQQELKDRKDAKNAAKRKRNELKKQQPIKKSRLEEIKRLYEAS